MNVVFQRAAPKTFDKQMENIQAQKDAKKEEVGKQKAVYKEAKNYYRHHRSNDKAKKCVMFSYYFLDNIRFEFLTISPDLKSFL